LGFFLSSLTASAVWASQGEHGSEAGMTHRMMMLVVQLGVIVFAARIGNILFERLRMPGVVGELMAGVLIGPYVLGAIALPGFPRGLFYVGPDAAVGTIPVSPELYGVCSIASVVLLFMVGLETDIKLFMRYSLAGSLVGVGGVTTSFLCGAFMAMWFSPMLFGTPLSFFDPPCLFLGIISTATSVGITARILSEQRKLESPEGVTILAGAVIDDVLGIILLAIGLGIISASRMSGGIDWGRIGAIALKAVGIWLAATAIGLLASRRISRLLKAFKDPSVIAIMALALALILAGLFEQTGLAMIIGAYVMGLSLSRTDLNQVIRERLHSTYVLLVPVFFTVMGMLVDVRLLASREVLLFGFLYTVIAGLAKVGGCGIPALFVNFNPLGALRIGTGMLPRGEVTLIIAGTGLAAGVLNPQIFGVVVLMTFCAALFAPPLLVALFRNPASGLRRPLELATGEPVTFSFPSIQAAELLVSKLFHAFEAEGFFVHTLSHNERLYQLRKEDRIIGFQHRGSDIVFDCTEADVGFVNTAMLEVVAELEQTIHELRKPLDVTAIGKRMQQASPGSESAVSLAGFLHVKSLVPRLQATTKREVIDELLELLHDQGLVHDLDEARRAVLSREASMSTGMQYGIAIPHGRSDAVSTLISAFGLQPRGVDFDAMDGRPSRIFVLTLSPASAAAPHMQFMSMVSQALNEQGRAALLSCDTAEEMYAVLTGQAPPQAAADYGHGLLERLTKRRASKPTLEDFLQRDLLAPVLQATTKQQVIDELVSLAARKGRLQNVDQAKAAVLEREAQMSTGMEHGVAIPHARTDAVDQVVCVVGLKPEGIDFGSLDGEPSTLFLLTLTPTDETARHVEFMALLSRSLTPEVRQRAIAATTPDELWNALVQT
jgi:Kef-type K+ transport system membrane component KefB/mannitol/fructose-specific phosphotransferase system IIA component (Ntr-type)